MAVVITSDNENIYVTIGGGIEKPYPKTCFEMRFMTEAVMAVDRFNDKAIIFPATAPDDLTLDGNTPADMDEVRDWYAATFAGAGSETSINSKTFVIGNSAGQYPAGSTIVDALLGLGDIATVSYNLQSYGQGEGWTQDKGTTTLNMGTLGSTSNGQQVTVYFVNAIKVSA